MIDEHARHLIEISVFLQWFIYGSFGFDMSWLASKVSFREQVELYMSKKSYYV